MISEWNIPEDTLKSQKQIDAQIQSAEQELAVLDEKRKQLQARINQPKGQKQSIADAQLPFDRLAESNVSNYSNEEQKITLFRSLFGVDLEAWLPFHCRLIRERKETVFLSMKTSILTLINGVTCQ